MTTYGPTLTTASAGVVARLAKQWDAARGRRAIATLSRVLPDFSPSDPGRGLVIAVANVLIDAIAPGSPRSHLVGGGGDVFLASPNPSHGAALVDATTHLLTTGDVTAALEKMLAVWDRPPEAAQLAAAARGAGVPIHFRDGALVLGLGRRAQWYCDAYFSDRNGLTAIANDKLMSSALLARAGIPCTRPRVVLNEDEAAAAARQIGFPVVVKPNRGWAQVGVWLALESESAVRRAFRRAFEQSGALCWPLLVEKHYAGSYVRATLVAGEPLAILRGEEPRVKADGRRAASELAGMPRFPRPRDLAVLEAVLASEGLSPGDVPERGREIHVAHANAGRLVDVTRAAHPTLVGLLRRVGALFPLPAVGVDLLVRDPSRPFDGVILEVNPAPAFSMHDRVHRGRRRDLAPAILRSLYPRAVRDALVPVVVGRRARGLHAIARRLTGLHVSGYTDGAAWSAAPEYRVGSGVASAALAVLDPRADVIVVEVDDAMARDRGLVVESADYLVDGPDDAVGRWLRRSLRPGAAEVMPALARIVADQGGFSLNGKAAPW
jgi:cyanophycin synthetase